MVYIENDGALFRGPARGVPLEVWSSRQAKFLPYADADKPRDVSWGTEIDEDAARKMMETIKGVISEQEHYLLDGYDGNGREVSQAHIEYLMNHANPEVKARAEEVKRQQDGKL